LIFAYSFVIFKSMTTQRTIEIPADRRVQIDLTLPETFMPGSTIKFEINSSVIAVGNNAAPAKNKETMRAALETMCGLYAGMEPPGSYLERHHAENELEWEIEERRCKEREQLEK
jgi:hypothetical protein